MIIRWRSCFEKFYWTKNHVVLISFSFFPVRYLIASHTTDYQHPMLFFNSLAVIVLVIAKFPNMHKVRIFGINGDKWVGLKVDMFRNHISFSCSDEELYPCIEVGTGRILKNIMCFCSYGFSSCLPVKNNCIELSLYSREILCILRITVLYEHMSHNLMSLFRIPIGLIIFSTLETDFMPETEQYCVDTDLTAWPW